MLWGVGDVIREYNALHEENFSSSWLREGLVEKEERKKKVNERIREGERKEGEKRGGKEKRWRERRERDGECQKKECRFNFCGGL